MKIISNEKVDKLSKRIARTTFAMLEQPAKRLAFGLSFVSKTEIRDLNKSTRDIDGVTDVLSFPTLDINAGSIIDIKDYPNDYDRKLRALNIGDIVICSEVADEQAEASGHSKERERGFLLLHGLLHLLGYDHIDPTDEALMRECQRMILKKVKLGVEEE